MPKDICEALQALIGHSVVITANGTNYTGTLASVNNIVILSTARGVVYIRTGDVSAVVAA